MVVSFFVKAQNVKIYLL